MVSSKQAKISHRTYVVFDILGFDCFVRSICRIQRGEGDLERLVDNWTHLSYDFALYGKHVTRLLYSQLNITLCHLKH